MEPSARPPRHIALVPAAGSGSRFGGAFPKQYHCIAGRPMLWHTLRRLAAHPRIDLVAVVLAADDGFFELRDWSEIPNLELFRCGGATRAHTVRNGLEMLAGEAADGDWILVHDAARPCLPHAVIDRMISQLAEDPVGGIAAIPVADTLKRAGAGQRVEATVSRERLWAAQTPQMFRHGVLRRALSGDLEGITDEAAAVERLSLAPKLVEGDTANLKVTFEGDLRIAEQWLLRASDA